MFDMQKIGVKIAQLRKVKNLTQMELADHLGISFQAVSNWERGNSMPDISKLPELAQLFDVSIDELLGQQSSLVESVINDRTDIYIEEHNIPIDELVEVAPIIKPNQLDDIVEKVCEKNNLSEIQGLLPFMSSKAINRLTIKYFESGNMSELHKVLPFADSNVVDDLAKRMIESGTYTSSITPFVSDQLIGEWAVARYGKDGILGISDIMPFIPESILNTIAEQEFSKYGIGGIRKVAPFLGDSVLNDYAKRVIEKEGIQGIKPIAPFIAK